MKKNIICLFSALSVLGASFVYADDTMSSSMTTVNCENYNEGDENAEIVPGLGFKKSDVKKDKFKFDVANVLTVKGTVVKVIRVNKDGKCRVFLIVKTNDGRALVKLRSHAFLEQNGVMFNEGDDIEIKGSLNKENGRIFIIAKEITKDGNTVKFRDDQGNPVGSDDSDSSSTKPQMTSSY